MARGTTPPGQLGEEARHEGPTQGAENAVGIDEAMRSGKPVQSVVTPGPKRDEKSGAFHPAAYELPKRPKASRPFIRIDR